MRPVCVGGRLAGGLLGCRDSAAAWPNRWVRVLRTADHIDDGAHRIAVPRTWPDATSTTIDAEDDEPGAADG